MSDHDKDTLYPKHAEEPRLSAEDVRRIALEVVIAERNRVVASLRKVIDAAINSPNMSRDEQDALIVQVCAEIFPGSNLAEDLATLLREAV